MERLLIHRVFLVDLMSYIIFLVILWFVIVWSLNEDIYSGREEFAAVGILEVGGPEGTVNRSLTNITFEKDQVSDKLLSVAVCSYI